MFRFTSPTLHEYGPDSHTLRECPTGRTLREAPYVFDVLNARADNAGMALLRAPRRLQRMFAIAASEEQRLEVLEERRRQSERDAAHGARILRGK